MRVLKRLAERPRATGKKRIVLRFLASPVAVSGDASVRAVTIASNRMETNAAGDSVAVSTGVEEEIKAGLVLKAIGYRGVALKALPFDPVKGLIPSRAGRVLEGGAPMPGVYVAGWIKRGPRGVIGSNKKCALETVNCLLADLAKSPRPMSAVSRPEIEAHLRDRKPDLVTQSCWNRIDRSERHKGVLQGRPRVKYATWSELLSVAGY
jgi:ferredoxin--NADP+ reductase